MPQMKLMVQSSHKLQLQSFSTRVPAFHLLRNSPTGVERTYSESPARIWMQSFHKVAEHWITLCQLLRLKVLSCGQPFLLCPYSNLQWTLSIWHVSNFAELHDGFTRVYLAKEMDRIGFKVSYYYVLQLYPKFIPLTATQGLLLACFCVFIKFTRVTYPMQQ